MSSPRRIYGCLQATAWRAPWRQHRGGTLLPLAAAPPALQRPSALPRPAPAWSARPGEGSRQRRRQRHRGGRELQAPEQDGGAGTARARRPAAASRPRQLPARAPVSSAALSGARPGRGRRGAKGTGSPGRGGDAGGPASESLAREGWRGRSAFPGPRGAQGHRPAGAALAGNARARGPCPPAASPRCAPRNSDASPQDVKGSERMAGPPGEAAPRGPHSGQPLNLKAEWIQKKKKK